MTSSQEGHLGVLLLDRGLPPDAPPPVSLPGSIHSPETLGAPIIWETVEGAWAETVVRGDPSLETSYVAAARRLVVRGAVAISSNCGFAIRYQPAVAAAVDVPVAMSSLLLLPTLLRQVSPASKIAVLTFDSNELGADVLGIDDPTERSRVVIGGVEGGRFWQEALMRPPVWSGVEAVENDVAACLTRLRAEHPGIAAVLFECTAFAMVARAIRKVSGLPVYDITTAARLTLASLA